MPPFHVLQLLVQLHEDFIARTSFELWQNIFVCDLVHKNMSKPPFLGTEDFPLQCIAMVELILLNLSLLNASSLTVDAVWVLEGVKVEQHSSTMSGSSSSSCTSLANDSWFLC